VIERVKKIHSRIGGERPDGRAYRALDPELIAWVHTVHPLGGDARLRDATTARSASRRRAAT
jgi:hypothetical protein